MSMGIAWARMRQIEVAETTSMAGLVDVNGIEEQVCIFQSGTPLNGGPVRAKKTAIEFSVSKNAPPPYPHGQC